jgi:hypothetical protein
MLLQLQMINLRTLLQLHMIKPAMLLQLHKANPHKPKLLLQ